MSNPKHHHCYPSHKMVCILEWLFRLIFDRYCFLITWQVRPGEAARAGTLLLYFMCLSSVASLRPFPTMSTPFPMAFLHCVWSSARSSYNEGVMLAFLRLLCRTSLNLNHCSPHLWAPWDSWPTWHLWAVFCQAFLQHVHPSTVGLTTLWLWLLAFQLWKGPKWRGPCLTR